MRTPALAIALLLAACGPSAPPGPPPQTVVTVTLEPKAAAVNASYVGTAESVEQVEIRPRVGGLLERRVATEGQRVKKGQTLFVIEDQPFRDAQQQARAALSQARAQAGQAAREYRRAQSMGPKGGLSQQEIDAVLTRNESAKAAVSSAEAAANLADLNLSYAQVTSPIDGVMGRAEVKDGTLVTAFTTLLTTVYATDPIAVNIALSEADLRALESALGKTLSAADAAPMPAQLILSDGTTFSEPGQLDFVAPAVDPATGTVALRLRFANAEGRLRAGQFVRVVLTTRNLADAILVPQRALQDLQGKRYVWIVDGQGKAQQRDVEPGAQVGADVLITRGLAAGEKVIVDGFQRLKADTPVKP